MKNMNKIYLLCICFNCAISLSAQNNNTQYDFPIKRGTAAWNNIKNYKELRNISQIPEDIVNRMTTEVLFESILNYPLLGDAFVFTTFQKGIENLKINFNAFETLSIRPDLGKTLINKYVVLATKKFNNESLIIKGEHSVKLSFIELIFAQSSTNLTLTKEELLSLIRMLIGNYNEKKKNIEIYGTMSLSTCAWAIDKILVFNNADEKFVVRNKLVEDGNVFSQEILNEIVDKAQKYIETVNH